MADRSDRFEHWSSESPWSIPVDDANSSLEIVTPQAFPFANPADMPGGAELCEPLDSPMHQVSLTRPATGVRPSTRAHHNMAPRSPSFSSRGYYSTEFDLAGNSLTASRLPDAVNKKQSSIDGNPSTSVGYICFVLDCKFEGETYAELR